MLIQLTIFAFCFPLFGARFVVLDNGTPIAVERWQQQGDQVLLYREGTQLTIPASRIREFVEEEEVEIPPPAPLPAEPAATPPESMPPPPPDPKQVIAEMAESYGLPERFVLSVARTESGLAPQALSSKGAIGVMQLMPATARDLGVDPHDVRQNIEGGARLLRDLLLRYQNDPDQVRKALAAYNAGAGAVDKYRGVPPYQETRRYVEKVLKNYQGAKK